MLPGRTRGAIYLIKDKLNAHSLRNWSEQERQILAKYHSTEGMVVADRLAERTKAAVRQAAYAMGLNLPDSETRPVQQKWRREATFPLP